MFDPTIFDNVKVVLEGAVYDMDLSGRIRILNREDLIDLSSMSRRYMLRFADSQDTTDCIFAEIHLKAGMSDLAAEILESDKAVPGCILEIVFEERVENGIAPLDDICERTQMRLADIWGSRYSLHQTVSYAYGLQPNAYVYRTRLDFGRKFDENVIEDIPELLEHTLLSLQRLAAS